MVAFQDSKLPNLDLMGLRRSHEFPQREKSSFYYLHLASRLHVISSSMESMEFC